jgi:hypothetical protein
MAIDAFAPVIREPRGVFPTPLFDERGKLASAVAYQLSGGLRLSASEVVLD